MKPSPYFADSIRYFFKRFASKESLLRWFIKKAGNSSEAFEYPIKLKNCEGVLVILPELANDVVSYVPFLEELKKLHLKGIVLANKRHESFLKSLNLGQKVVYYTGLGCRFGEEEFKKIDALLHSEKFTISLYLEPKQLYQLLYLAKSCGATYRFGFDCEKFFPLLNLSLITGGDSAKQAEFLTDLFRKALK